MRHCNAMLVALALSLVVNATPADEAAAAFKRGRLIATDALMSDLLIEHVRAAGTIDVPPAGRLVPA